MAEDDPDSNKSKARPAFLTLLTLLAIGLAGIVVYSFCATCNSNWYRDSSVGVLIAGASLTFGGFFGFLFGMPRTPTKYYGVQPLNEEKNQETSETNRLGPEPNTNLEQISDWLTKILVGAGLTQLNKIPSKLEELSTFLAMGMSDTYADRAFIVAIITYFGISGFLAVFLWTRLYMAALLPEAVNKIQAMLAKQRQELTKTDQKQQQEIETSRNFIKKLAESGAERAMEDPLLSERQPTDGDTRVEVAAELVKNTNEENRSATDLMILAFHEFQAQNYKAASENAEKALAASPQKEMLWKIYNLLGLCYHWQQPLDWKPGADMTWFDKAKKSYELASANRNSLSEELLSKANLCFVYLDAQKYSECEQLAQEVIDKENIGGMQIASICDLARVASAAAKVLEGGYAEASTILNSTKNLPSIEYIFNPEDLPPKALSEFVRLPNLNPEVEAVLKKTLGRQI